MIYIKGIMRMLSIDTRDANKVFDAYFSSVILMDNNKSMVIMLSVNSYSSELCD